MAKSSLLPSSHHLSLFQNRTTTPPAHLLEHYFTPGHRHLKATFQGFLFGLMFWMWLQWTLDRFEMIILSTSRSKDIREGCLRERIPRLRSHLDPPVVNIYHPKLIFHSALDYAPRATMFLHSSFAQKSS